jgi:hypothetical protein
MILLMVGLIAYGTATVATTTKTMAGLQPAASMQNHVQLPLQSPKKNHVENQLVNQPMTNWTANLT